MPLIIVATQQFRVQLLSFKLETLSLNFNINSESIQVKWISIEVVIKQKKLQIKMFILYFTLSFNFYYLWKVLKLKTMNKLSHIILAIECILIHKA